jgi:KDO2-lipid IV(A) lauroyltransferase
MGHVWQKPWQYTQNLIVEVEGAALIEEARAAGRGVIVLGPHLGNWEVLGLHLATLGDLVALFAPPRIATLGQLIQDARERSGGRLVPTTPRGIAALVRSVRNGGISGILPDQVPDDPRAGLNVPFMGEPAFTATLATNLIQRSGAVALMGAALRVPGGFKVLYRPVREALYSDQPEDALTALNADVADLIRGWDAQYQWQYKRFRCVPPGPVDHYLDLMRPRQ